MSLIPKSGLILEWLFSGNTYDTSGYSQNGSVVNATLTNDRKNKANSAYSFNGSTAKISISDLNIGKVNSISVWFYKNASHDDTIIGVDASYYFRFSNNSLTTRTLGGYTTLSVPTFTLNTWNHAVFVRNNATIKVYINNVYVGSVNLPYNEDYLFRGVGGFSNFWMNGYIDDCRIYTRQLAVNEINALYNE